MKNEQSSSGVMIKFVVTVLLMMMLISCCSIKQVHSKEYSTRANNLVNIIVKSKSYQLNTLDIYSIRELEYKYNTSPTYDLLYGIPLKYERTDSNPIITSLNSVIALFTNESKAYLVVDPYNIQYSTDIAKIGTTLPSLFNDSIYGTDFYIKKLLDWQGTDPTVSPQCSYLTNYELDKTKAEYNTDLFYCDSSQLNDNHIFTLSSSSKKIISKYDNTCLQFVDQKDSKTNTIIPFQFSQCRDTKLQEYGYNGQYFSQYGDAKILFVADKSTTSQSAIVAAPGTVDLGSFSDLNEYGRNLQYPYRAYQFYLEPVTGYNRTVTVSNSGPYVYPPLSLSNQTYIAELNNIIDTNGTLYLKTSVVNRLYTGYQKQKRLPFPIPPDELLYAYIFLPVVVFFGGFLVMFISVSCCWIFVYIKKTYCKP